MSINKVEKNGKTEYVADKKSQSLLEQSMKSGPSKQIQESLSGRINEKVITHYNPTTDNDEYTYLV